MFDDLAHPGRDAVGVALGRSGPGERCEGLAGGAAVGGDLVGVLVAEFAEREAALVGDSGGVGEGVRVVAEEAGEFGGGLEVALGVGLQAPAGVVDGAVLADAGERVVEAAARGVVLVDVAGGDEGEALGGGEVGEVG